MRFSEPGRVVRDDEPQDCEILRADLIELARGNTKSAWSRLIASHAAECPECMRTLAALAAKLAENDRQPKRTHGRVSGV